MKTNYYVSKPESGRDIYKLQTQDKTTQEIQATLRMLQTSFPGCRIEARRGR